MTRMHVEVNGGCVPTEILWLLRRLPLQLGMTAARCEGALEGDELTSAGQTYLLAGDKVRTGSPRISRSPTWVEAERAARRRGHCGDGRRRITVEAAAHLLVQRLRATGIIDR